MGINISSYICHSFFYSSYVSLFHYVYALKLTVYVGSNPAAIFGGGSRGSSKYSVRFYAQIIRLLVS